MSDVRSVGVTAFDLFGVLLPGILLVLALRIMLTPLLGPLPLALDTYSYAGWGIIGLACYIAGHVAQLVARLVERVTSLVAPWGEVFRLSVNQPRQPETAFALHLIRQRLRMRTGLDLQRLSDVVLSNLTDEFVEQYGNAATLANYRSREVYYRGISAAMVLLAIAFIECAVLRVAIVDMPDLRSSPVGYGALALLSLATGFATGDAYRRQRRRRMRHSLLGYLALESGGRLGPPVIGVAPPRTEQHSRFAPTQ